MQITVSLEGPGAKLLRQLSRQIPQEIAAGLNVAGAGIRRATVLAEAKQTGLSHRTINKAQRASPASPGNLVYSIAASGGNIRLKYFKARETRAGVSAAPWNARKVFPGAFMKGGRFPSRVALNMGGHAFQRTGQSRLPIAGRRSGLFIPQELVVGHTASAFNAKAEQAADVVLGRLARLFG